MINILKLNIRVTSVNTPITTADDESLIDDCKNPHKLNKSLPLD